MMHVPKTNQTAEYQNRLFITKTYALCYAMTDTLTYSKNL